MARSTGTPCWPLVMRACPVAATRADDAAMIIYTSGTTGPPKGADPASGDVWQFVRVHFFRTTCSRNPTMSFGHRPTGRGLAACGMHCCQRCSLVIRSSDTVAALTRAGVSLMERHKVTCTFLFPTALKMLMKAVPNPGNDTDCTLRSIMSAGERRRNGLYMGRKVTGITLNEMFGQTELNYVVGNRAKLWPARPGSMGRAYPGHQVAVISALGRVAPVGETGEVAVNRRDIHGDLDPVFSWLPRQRGRHTSEV